MLLVLVVLAGFATHPAGAGGSNTVQGVRPEQTSSNQQIHNRIRTAEWLGLDAAIARRNSICINNDLRPECRDGKEGDFETGPFYVDFDRHTKRCFVTMNKPVGHTVDGGGPFQTRAKARAAIKMISGC